MKKLLALMAVIAITNTLSAMPAYRHFSDYTQPDGTTLTLTPAGDEFAHWFEAADGTIYRLQSDGFYRATGETQAEALAKRKLSPKHPASSPRRARKDVGTPNLAPRGLLIMVNFSDLSFKSTNTQADIYDMMNGENYTYGGTHASARQYFYDQSEGQYEPVFDVYGPVTLSHAMSYYGTNDSNGEDVRPADMVVEACKLVNESYDVDFSLYDNDNDGYVDFVYVLYAGKGEADGGAATTIWPHNWSIQSAIYSNDCSYTKQQAKVDGLYLDNYACSGELNGGSGARNSIGTICHEFGHVIGLPDYYDTAYGTNYDDGYTPNEWDIMDGGGYNGSPSGTCPPNYSAWEKAFFGWATPINLGSTAQSLTLIANGQEGYQCYQVNSSGTYQSPTTSGVCYYIENRQKTGWDTYAPGHGMLVWKVDYSQTAWENNEPNNTDRSPKYTIVSASGSVKNIGSAADPYPGTSNAAAWRSITSKPIVNIVESNGVITCDFIEAGGPSSDISLDFATLIAEIDEDVVMLTFDTEDYSSHQETGTELTVLLSARVSNSIVGSFLVSDGNAALAGAGGTLSVDISNLKLTVVPETDGYTFYYDFESADLTTTTGSFTITADNILAVDGNEDEIVLTDAVTPLYTSEALALIDALPNSNATDLSFFVSGKISTMRNTAAQIVQYKTARFNISDDGTTASELYSYNTKWLNNTSFSTGTEVAQGDSVIIYGPLQNYSGNTPEINKGYVYEYHSAEEIASALVETSSHPLPEKRLQDGQLIIIRDNKHFNALGQEL